MATNNVYKPGWRSRRRSRLSLVERAVPRLGRLPAPEDKPKPDTSSAQSKPPALELDKEIGSDQKVELDQKADSDGRNDLGVRVEPLSLSNEPVQQSKQYPTATTPPPTVPSSTSPPSKELEDELAEQETAAEPTEETVPESDSDHDVEIELDVDVDDFASDEILLPDRATSQSSSTDLVPVVDRPMVPEASSPETSEPTSERKSVPGVIEGHWDVHDAPTVGDSRREQGSVQLDWEALVSSGFVDPRDRARPLSANMDEIARALVRQALSDQSSWRDRIILVSSARESRAKSMAALNFAFALTTINRHSVVLLDANMDGTGAAQHAGASEHPGLTTALCDSNVEVDEITLETSLDGLTLVASGAYEEDILDRFASRRMLEILRFLTKDPETLLVLDAPPILSSQEAAVLSVIAGQVVLVVEAGTTDENSINQALKRIGDRHNLSLVLSDHAGIDYDEPVVERAPSNNELPLPLPRKPASKRRHRRAMASLVIGIIFGLNALISGGPLPYNLDEKATLLTESSNLDRSTFKIKPIVPQTSAAAR